MRLPHTARTEPALAIDMREELVRLEEAVAALRRQVRAERRRGVPDRATLEAALDEAERDVLDRDAEVTRLRQFARRRKDEISGWKDWYATQDAQLTADTVSNLERLNAEIGWRAAEIAATESEIQKRLAALVDAEGVAARLGSQLAALDAGAYGMPMRDDPRLNAAERALEAARAEIDQAEADGRSVRAGRTRNHARFEIEVSRDGRRFFNLKAPNGRVILTSARHARTADVLDAIAAVRACATGGAHIEHRRSRAGEPYFVVTSTEGSVLGRGEMYSSKRAMENGARSVATNAPTAAVRDLT